MRDQIFISYSHADSEYQLRLRKHLSIFERAGNIRYWADTQLRTEDPWQKEIDDNLNRTAVAILLISADFLASDFIRSDELPPLLKAWEQNDVYILPVIVKPCSFSHVKELCRFQAVNNPERTISEMENGEQERTWMKLAEAAFERLSEYQSAHPDNARLRNPDHAIGHAVPTEMAISSQILPTDIADLLDLHIDFEDEEDTISEISAYPADLPAQEDSLIFDYIRDLLEDPERIQTYYVYTYEHIDILNFLPPAKDMFGEYAGYPSLLKQVRDLFSRNGWEGDGEIRLMWFPPFLRIGVEDTWGTLAWFVKQNNNGTSFIASPVPIPYLQLPSLQILTPDSNGYYTAQIAEVRRNINPKYRCFKLRGLLDQVTEYVPDETHWLLYRAGDFTDPSVNNWVRFRVKAVCGLRNFPDIQNTRNIYLHSLEILS